VEDPVPTYQYACTECDHAFEQFQSFSEDSLTVCPRCEGRLRKVFNAVGVVFKGSGFYRTDNRSDSKSASTPAASTTSSDATSGSATKTETKTETKSASPAA
jgi:putative FmdB family regulatory protein